MPKKQNSDLDSQSFIRSARRQIVHSSILAAAAMGVIVFACYAWFAGNTRVNATIGSIQMLGSLYELAGEGTTQEDTGYGAFYKTTATEGFSFSKLPVGNFSKNTNGNDLEATGGQQAIRWRLNDNSKIGNYGTDTGGIHPGSSGTLQFYIIPKVTGTLKLKFQLDLNPLNDNGTANTEQLLNDLLKGHLVFSLAANGSNNTSWLSWDGNTFEWQFDVNGEDSVGVPQLVTLNWKWPEDVANIRSDELLQNKVAQNASLLFLKDDNKALEPAKYDSNQLETLNRYYNNADDYIGENLTWLEVKLSADLASNSTNN